MWYRLITLFLSILTISRIALLNAQASRIKLEMNQRFEPYTEDRVLDYFFYNLSQIYPPHYIEEIYDYTKIVIGSPKVNPCHVSAHVPLNLNHVEIFTSPLTSLYEMEITLRNEGFHLAVRHHNLDLVNEIHENLPHLNQALRKNLFYPFINNEGKIDPQKYKRYKNAINAFKDRMATMRDSHIARNPAPDHLLSVMSYYEPLVHNSNTNTPFFLVDLKNYGLHSAHILEKKNYGKNKKCYRYMAIPTATSAEDKFSALLYDWDQQHATLTSTEIYRTENEADYYMEVGSDLFTAFPRPIMERLAPEFLAYMDEYFQNKMPPAPQITNTCTPNPPC